MVGEVEPRDIDAKPQSNPSVVAQLNVFRECFQPITRLIYYPCCGTDVSPTRAFPDSQVIYVDVDEKSMQTLRRKGYQAYGVDAYEFVPGKVDILIMLNPGVKTESPAHFVKDGGYVLCNNYLRTASDLHNNPQYEFKGVVVKNGQGKFELDAQNLEEYWREIETDEEYKQKGFEWICASQIVAGLTGNTENILKNIKKIMADRLKRSQDDGDYRVIAIGNQVYLLPSSLPHKKGSSDDLYIFQKRPIP